MYVYPDLKDVLFVKDNKGFQRKSNTEMVGNVQELISGKVLEAQSCPAVSLVKTHMPATSSSKHGHKHKQAAERIPYALGFC